jgi:hypothetical protein
MKRTIIIKSVSVEVMQQIRHFGDFVTVPLGRSSTWRAWIGSIWCWRASGPGRCWNT